MNKVKLFKSKKQLNDRKNTNVSRKLLTPDQLLQTSRIADIQV